VNQHHDLIGEHFIWHMNQQQQVSITMSTACLDDIRNVEGCKEIKERDMWVLGG